MKRVKRGKGEKVFQTKRGKGEKVFQNQVLDLIDIHTKEVKERFAKLEERIASDEREIVKN